MQNYLFYQKKNIYGKNVKIYRKKNSKKEYVKYKNEMILIRVYKKLKKKNYKKKSKGGIFSKSLAKKAAETKKQIEICCANSANEFKLNICLDKHNISRVPNALQTLCYANKNYETNRIISNRNNEIDKKLRFERMLKTVEHRVNPSLYNDENIRRSIRGLPRRD